MENWDMVALVSKDVNALLTLSKKYNIELNTIKGGWETNLKLRPEKRLGKKNRKIC